MDLPATDPPEPGAELIARFTADLLALRPALGTSGGERIGIAISGGPDSTALLLLAAAALPGRVEAATVDHGLRPESGDEARGVAGLCARLGLPHEILPVELAAGNLQAEARVARYAALAAWMGRRGLAALVTAHHADDQAETLIMRLNRASGVAGLAATRAAGQVPGSDRVLLRPLLDWRRDELAGVVAAAGVGAAADPSNHDERFDRVRLRKALAQCDWLDIAAIARSARHLADADAALDWAAGREWAECVRREGLGMVYRPQAPRAVALRVLARLVRELGDEVPRGAALARVFESLLAGSPASIGGIVARPGPAGWSFTRAPRRRSA